MLLGFISLLLTVGTQYIVKICIPSKLGEFMLPCKLKNNTYGGGGGGGDDDKERRKLLSYAEDEILWRRALANSASKYDYCSKYV